MRSDPHVAKDSGTAKVHKMMSYRRVVAAVENGRRVLQLSTAEGAAPGAGEVTVRMTVAGVSYGDILARVGVLPGSGKPGCVPGFDVTGTLEKVVPPSPAWRSSGRLPGRTARPLLHRVPCDQASGELPRGPGQTPGSPRTRGDPPQDRGGPAAEPGQPRARVGGARRGERQGGAHPDTTNQQ